MNWSDLSMSQRSELMSIYLKNGITSLDEMKKHYNSFAEGGNTDIPPFARRYNEGQRRAIPTSQGNATHYMAVDSYEDKHYVYPTVQPINYNDTNSPLKYYGDRAFDRALENNDVMEFPTLSDAIRYTENYKRPPSTGAYLNNEYHPVYTPYDYIRSFDTGGPIDPRRFFGIATPEVTDNTVYQPTYGTILPEVSVTPRGPIKELAHTINLYGNTVKYPKPRMMDFDEFKSRQQRTYKIYHPDSSEEAPYIYHQKYGKKYPFFPNQEEAKRMKYIKDSLYSNDYKRYKQKEFTRVNNSGSTPSQNAASLALVGSWFSLFPWTPAKVLGATAQVPDLVLDAAAAIDNPKVSTIGHNVIDYAPYIAKLIPGKYDDYVLKGLNLIGNTDDAISSKGSDLLENLDKPESEETFSRGGSIHIKSENRGKFTALKKRTGHSASWFKENGTPAQKKMAVFALNARKWKH